MPLYEYECDDCAHRFERIRKFSDPPLTTCPECDGPIRKLLSPPAIQFKGTGWYVTDYARKAGDGKPAEGGPEAGQEGKSANGSDAKPSGESTSSADGKSGDGSKSGSESRASGASASSGSDSAAKPSGSASSSAPG